MGYFSRLIEALVPSHDYGGAWITETGEVLICEYGDDGSHADVALQHYIDIPIIKTKDYTGDVAQDRAYHDGWVQIVTKGDTSITVEWRVRPSDRAKVALLSYLSGQTEYTVYEIEGLEDFEQFDNLKALLRFVKTHI